MFSWGTVRFNPTNQHSQTMARIWIVMGIVVMLVGAAVAVRDAMCITTDKGFHRLSIIIEYTQCITQ